MCHINWSKGKKAHRGKKILEWSKIEVLLPYQALMEALSQFMFLISFSNAQYSPDGIVSVFSQPQFNAPSWFQLGWTFLPHPNVQMTAKNERYWGWKYGTYRQCKEAIWELLRSEKVTEVESFHVKKLYPRSQELFQDQNSISRHDYFIS